MRRTRFVSLGSLLVLVCVYIQTLFLLTGCGGSGTSRPSIAAVNEAITSASTIQELERAFEDVKRATPVDVPFSRAFPLDKQVPKAATDVLFEAQLVTNGGGNAGMSIRDILREMRAIDPISIPNGTTDAQILERLNLDLRTAYASPTGTERNAALVLMTSPPGSTFSGAPTLTLDSEIAPMKTLILANYLGTQLSARSGCTIACRAAYTAAVAAIAAATVACSAGTWGIGAVACAAIGAAAGAAATFAYEECMASCHNQGG